MRPCCGCASVAFFAMFPTILFWATRGKRANGRLNLLFGGKIVNVGYDNGSEFQKDFAATCAKMGIPQYYSRPKTPKDNAVCERFNQTLRHEFLEMGDLRSDPTVFNRNLTEWLVEYNFKRPHQSLGHVPPINYEAKYLKVLPTYPSSTRS